MMEELESNNSADEVVESSSETPDSGSDKAGGEAEATKEASSSAPQTKNPEPPWHESPRFKEIIEQKNQAIAQAKALEQRTQQLEAKFLEMSKPKDQSLDKRAAMIERLKGIDPEFTEFLLELAPNKSIEAMKAELAQERQEKFRTSAVSEVERLHSDNKVAEGLKARYNAELELAYSRGQIRSMDDVKTLYKQIHDGYTKLLEDVRRSERETYVAGKKADASAPTSQPKGKPAQLSNKFNYSKDPEEARAQMVKRYVELSKANKDL